MSNLIKIYILLLALSFVDADVFAQSISNFEKLQNTTLQHSSNKNQKESKQKGKAQLDQIELSLNDSLFKVFDVDIDLALGDISSDDSWGDPVKNPRIRCNKASNLYGPVRHYADGCTRWHRGFDYYAPKGTPVYSVGNGVVSLIQNHPDYGLCVLITHKRPNATYYSFYAHLSSIYVEYGETVKKGAVLGKSGVTGNAHDLSGQEEHLHFEYRTSPKHGDRKQSNPNAILKTKFYSADPKNKWQSNVGIIKKSSMDIF